MDENEFEIAHVAYQTIDNVIVTIGKAVLSNLNEEQKEYVVRKLSDEFRFWRMNDG